MSKSAAATPNITVKLEGLMALFFDKDGGGQRVRCKVGVVKDADHKPSLTVTEQGQNIPVGSIGSRLELDVQNSGSPGLKFAAARQAARAYADHYYNATGTTYSR